MSDVLFIVVVTYGSQVRLAYFVLSASSEAEFDSVESRGFEPVTCPMVIGPL
jgi:hypothetical protein